MPPAGRLGDRARADVDAHGCPGCPHAAQGPAICGSPTIRIDGRPALRVGDRGVHAACCGPNTWVALEGSGTVFIDGRPLHRLGDNAAHCGGTGRLIEGSSTVSVGGPPTLDRSAVPGPKIPPWIAGLASDKLPEGMPIPPGASLEKNIAEAERYRNTDPLLNSMNPARVPLWFYNQVNTGGDWAYKQSGHEQYQDFGNFNYGATGRALGFSRQTLLRMAGWKHIRDGSLPSEGHYLDIGDSCYGDDCRDQEWIIRGMDYYDNNYGPGAR